MKNRQFIIICILIISGFIVLYLQHQEIKKHIDIYKTTIENVGTNYTTVEETQNFISLAGRELIEQYNIIDHNKILELKVPKCLV